MKFKSSNFSTLDGTWWKTNTAINKRAKRLLLSIESVPGETSTISGESDPPCSKVLPSCLGIVQPWAMCSILLCPFFLTCIIWTMVSITEFGGGIMQVIVLKRSPWQ